MSAAHEPQINPQERDFDLLLMDQIAFDSDFFSRFLERLGLNHATPASIRHSVYENFGGDAWGETDILIQLTQGPTLLVENKMSAPFQDLQAQRYRARADHHRVQDLRAKTVLVAPDAYLIGVPANEWDQSISYEEMAKMIFGEDARAIWRRSLLYLAGKRGARMSKLASNTAARKAVANELSAFKSAWHQFITNGQEWQANHQTGSVDEFLYTPRHNPKKLRIWHHPMAGYLSVQIPKEQAKLAELSFPSQLPEGMRIKLHPSTIYLDASVEAIDMSASFEEERQKVVASMAIARRALNFVEAALK